ncbi:MAG: helix-turn-helix transcriptional regulator [Clostridia bacterium]
MNSFKKAREARGIAQGEVAKTINIAQTQLSQFESGTKTPSLNMAIAMQRLYNCSLDVLVHGKEFEKK